MNVTNAPLREINQQMVEHFDRKITRNKNLQMLELFLETMTHAEFSSPEVYINFIKLLNKAKFNNPELLLKTLTLFRQRLGLPAEAFEENVLLIASDKETHFPFSKELLTGLSNYYKTMFSSGFLESQENRVETRLSKETLQIFKTYVYGGKLESASIEALKELLDFSQMIMDNELQTMVSKTIFDYFLDENNEGSFDAELMAEHATEFTKQYLEKKQIQYEILYRCSYSIPLSGFLLLFAREFFKLSLFYITGNRLCKH